MIDEEERDTRERKERQLREVAARNKNLAAVADRARYVAHLDGFDVAALARRRLHFGVGD